MNRFYPCTSYKYCNNGEKKAFKFILKIPYKHYHVNFNDKNERKGLKINKLYSALGNSLL